MKIKRVVSPKSVPIHLKKSLSLSEDHMNTRNTPIRVSQYNTVDPLYNDICYNNKNSVITSI